MLHGALQRISQLNEGHVHVRGCELASHLMTDKKMKMKKILLDMCDHSSFQDKTKCFKV